MRRVTMMLAAMALMVPLFAAVAYAATIIGTDESEILLDSTLDDTIAGRGGGDELRADAFGPAGFLQPTPTPQDQRDTDKVHGNRGNDLIRVDDGDGRDTATGGRGGDDRCVGDPGDELDCELESQ